MKQKEKRESIVLLSPANKKQRVVCDAVESSESSSEYESESSDEDLFDKKKKFFKISQSGEMSEQIDLSSNEGLLYFNCFMISKTKLVLETSYC